MTGQTGNIMLKSGVFHKSTKGASHIASGKPCQDYSISYEENGIQIVVVCDGHGGDIYVRSDKGAKIAAEITVDCLKNFARTTPENMFCGKAFSITAKPQKNPFIDVDGRKLKYEELDETQRAFARQAKAYFDVEGECKEQQATINELIGFIYREWINQINNDEKKHPFDKNERASLKNHSIEKAYGCTLLAFLRTNKYWLAFQIGDGDIYIFDKDNTWSKPVPEDCSCFLNYTTSLCDKNPKSEFRYAFDGLNEQPVAVFVSSDGVDGALRTKENIQDFYEQIIGLYVDGDDVDKELDGYLPTMSEMGKKDDVSVAGIVDIDVVDVQELKKVLDLRQREREIRGEYRKRKDALESIETRINNLKIRLEKQKDTLFMRSGELEELKKDIVVREKEVKDLESSISLIKQDIEEQRKIFKDEKAELEEWKITTKLEMTELESEQEESDSIDENSSNITNW